MKRGKPLTLDAIHLGILEHCLAKPASLKPLFGPLASRPRVYRHAAELVSAGFLRVVGRDRREATEAGRRSLEESRSFGPGENPLNARYPPLRRWSPRYAAFLRLQFLASFAREHKLRESHHPTFLLVAETLRLKTTSAVFACIALGADPVKMIFLTPSESGRSPFLRKTYGGRIASARAALKSRFVCFDEYHKATAAARQAILPYTAGSLEVPVENDVLHVRPVPLIVMNPRKGRTLEEKTGFGPAELRRMIPFLPTEEDVPEALRLQGDAIAAAARKAGKLAMPKRASVTVRAEDVAVLMRPRLTAEGLAVVDFELAAMLCEAMAAFAPVGYVEYVVRDLLAVYETAGWADPSWRLHLAGPMAVSAAPAAKPIPKPMTLRERTLAILAREDAVVPGDLDHHARLRRLDAFLRERKFDPQDAMDKAEAMVAWDEAGFPWGVLTAAYEKWRTTKDDEAFANVLATIVERFRSFTRWEEVLAEQGAFLATNGGAWPDVEESVRLRRDLGGYGLAPKAGRELLTRIAAEMAERGLDPANGVRDLLNAYQVHGTLFAAVADHTRELETVKGRLAETRSRQEAEERARAEKRARWEQERTEHEGEVRQREERLTQLDRALSSKRASLGMLTAELSEVKGQIEEVKDTLARPTRALVVGEAVIQAAEGGKAESLLRAAKVLVDMPKFPAFMTPGTVRDTLRILERKVKEFVDAIDGASALVAKYDAVIAEKDGAIAALKDELKALRESVRGEGTA